MDYTTPGTILPNGAIVVAARFNMPGDEAVIVALSLRSGP